MSAPRDPDAIRRVLHALEHPVVRKVETTCPHCGKVNPDHGAADGSNDLPSAGAVSLCVGCLRPALFVNGPFGFACRAPTDDELASIEADPGYQEALAVLRRARDA